MVMIGNLDGKPQLLIEVFFLGLLEPSEIVIGAELPLDSAVR